MICGETTEQRAFQKDVNRDGFLVLYGINMRSNWKIKKMIPLQKDTGHLSDYSMNYSDHPYVITVIDNVYMESVTITSTKSKG